MITHFHCDRHKISATTCTNSLQSMNQPLPPKAKKRTRQSLAFFVKQHWQCKGAVVSVVSKLERSVSRRQSLSHVRPLKTRIQKYCSRIIQKLTVSFIITSWSTVSLRGQRAVSRKALQILPPVCFIATFSSTDHNISGTSTLTNRPFATETIPLPTLLPPDPACIPPYLASIILGLCEYSDRG